MIVVPVALHPLRVDVQVVEQEAVLTPVGVEHRTEQSEAVLVLQDEVEGCTVELCCDVCCELLSSSSSSSGSLGVSGLLGVLGSLGLPPEPPPPLSPPPPGGQKGQMQEGPFRPQPPVPPFHLDMLVTSHEASLEFDAYQTPPGPTMIIAAESVKWVPSLLVCGRGVVTVVIAVIVFRLSNVAFE